MNNILSLDWQILYKSWKSFYEGGGPRDLFLIKSPTFKGDPTLEDHGWLAFFNIQRLTHYYKLYFKCKPTFLSLSPLLSSIRQNEDNILSVEKTYFNVYNFLFSEKKREGLETLIWELQCQKGGRVGSKEEIIVSVPLWFSEQYIQRLDKVNEIIHEVEEIIFHLNIFIPLTVFVLASVCLFLSLRYSFYLRLKRRQFPFLFVVFFHLLLLLSFILVCCTALLFNRYCFLKNLINEYHLSLVYHFFFSKKRLRKRKFLLLFREVFPYLSFVFSWLAWGWLMKKFLEGLEDERLGEEGFREILERLGEEGFLERLGEEGFLEGLGEEFLEALAQEVRRMLREGQLGAILHPRAAPAA